MIKTLMIGIWVAAVALGSVYGAIIMAKPGPTQDEVDEAKFFASLQRIDSDVISVPVISEGKVHGYFLTQVSFLIEPKDMEIFPITPQEIINDILITEFIGNRVIDFPNMSNFDLTEFRNVVGTALNDRVGREVFHDIIIGRLDYLGKADIRSNLRQKRYTMQDGSEQIGSESE